MEEPADIQGTSMVSTIPKVNPACKILAMMIRPENMLRGVPKRPCLTHAPVAAAYLGQPIVAEDQTYVSKDKWPAT